MSIYLNTLNKKSKPYFLFKSTTKFKSLSFSCYISIYIFDYIVFHL